MGLTAVHADDDDDNEVELPVAAVNMGVVVSVLVSSCRAAFLLLPAAETIYDAGCVLRLKCQDLR